MTLNYVKSKTVSTKTSNIQQIKAPERADGNHRIILELQKLSDLDLDLGSGQRHTGAQLHISVNVYPHTKLG